MKITDPMERKVAAALDKHEIHEYKFTAEEILDQIHEELLYNNVDDAFAISSEWQRHKNK